MLQGTRPERRYTYGEVWSSLHSTTPSTSTSAPHQATWTPHLDLSQLRSPAAVPHRQHVLIGIIHHTEESTQILKMGDTSEGPSKAWRSQDSWSKSGQGCHDRLREQKKGPHCLLGEPAGWGLGRPGLLRLPGEVQGGGSRTGKMASRRRGQLTATEKARAPTPRSKAPSPISCSFSSVSESQT